MAPSVRSARCTSQTIIFLGFLFTSLASVFAGIHMSRYQQLIKKSKYADNKPLVISAWKYWLVGYPILIGLWNQFIGAAGASTSKPKYSRNMLQIATFFICTLIQLAVESYAAYDLQVNYLQAALKRRINSVQCATNHWYTNCHVESGVTMCLVILAAFIILLSLWSVICCCGSICCSSNQVDQEPEEEPQQVVPQPTAGQGLMMQGTSMMVPVMYNSGVPLVPYRPTHQMEGNMLAMQSSAIPMMQFAPGSHQPLTGVPVLYNVPG